MPPDRTRLGATSRACSLCGCLEHAACLHGGLQAVPADARLARDGIPCAWIAPVQELQLLGRLGSGPLCSVCLGLLIAIDAAAASGGPTGRASDARWKGAAA